MGKFTDFLMDVIGNVASKTEEAREEARYRASCASDRQLEKMANSDNSIVRNAALEEMEKRNSNGLKKFKPAKFDPKNSKKF